MSRIFLVFLLILTITNCATYWKNRKNDSKDIIQLGLETPVYGAGFRIGPLPVGLFFAGGESEMGKKDLGSGVGLRGGETGVYHSQQLVFGFLGGESFHSGESLKDDSGKAIVDKHGIPVTEDERSNIKSYKLRYFSFINDPVEDRAKRKKAKFQKEFISDLAKSSNNPELKSLLPEEDPKPYGYPSHYIWQAELFLGAYGGVRLGVNFAELADFVIGFTTADILKDDLAGEAQD
jgi:hypothetical protein